ncbi:MAG: DUF3179 domain-containing protein [Woeseiaceae bacterium]
MLLLVSLIVSGCSDGGGGRGGPQGGGSTVDQWLIPPEQVVDGGPGLDGIPALENPVFESAATIERVEDSDLVIVVQSGDQVKVYPHDILDYHEVVNDGSDDAPFTVSYCPLTGSAVGWHGNSDDANSTYGVSGLLFNSNLILYDRQTRSFWSQMLQISVNGRRIRERPEYFKVFETRFATLKMMYPDAQVLTRITGHSRDYDDYPYGTYRTHTGLLFPVERQDNRRHPKERIVGIHNATSAKLYQLSEFGDTTQAINDQFAGQSIVVIGNTALNFSAIYSSELADGTVLSFMPIQNDLPNVMQDTEGNIWNVFGTAVSGPRAGEELQATASYVAMWFAWVAHFTEVQLHFN